MNKEIITLVYIYQWYIFIYITYIHVYLQMKQEIITLVTIITIINFIDDIFFIWTDTEENLVSFWKIATNFTPRFTNEKSREKINFLDVVIKIKESKITANLFCKLTDGHQYLHYDSCHAGHTKRSTVFSQTIRVERI